MVNLQLKVKFDLRFEMSSLIYPITYTGFHSIVADAFGTYLLDEFFY